MIGIIYSKKQVTGGVFFATFINKTGAALH